MSPALTPQDLGNRYRRKTRWFDRVATWFLAIERARVAEREVAFLRDMLKRRTSELQAARSKNLELRRDMFGIAKPKGRS